MKKRNKLHRVVALMVALVLAVSCMGTVPYYANTSFTGVTDFLNALNCPLPDGFVYDSNCDYVVFPSVLNSTGEDVVCIYEIHGSYNLHLSDGYFCIRMVSSSSYLNCFYYKFASDTWQTRLNYGTSGIDFTTIPVFEEFAFFWSDIPVYSSIGYSDISFEGSNGWINKKIVGGSLEDSQSYNSSLGYLQDVVQQQLYLEDDAWAVVSDTLMRKYSFSKTTTTGLDITEGDWCVRHYMQLEIRDLDDDKVIKTYDKVLCGEYPAGELKFMFHIKDTINNVHSASGFEGLSWWELEVLGHYMFYNNYLELVRYNEDGSVEYGGQLKIWKTSKNVFYTEKLDENGEATDEPLGNITHGGSGSGSTYEEAEKEADKNDNGSIGSSNFAGLETALGSFTSTIKVIPEVIASVFSFLPPWCLELCGIGFALLIVLIIYKTVT